MPDPMMPHPTTPTFETSWASTSEPPFRRDGAAPISRRRGPQPIERCEPVAKCHHCAMLGFSIAEKIVRWMQPAFASAGYAIVAAGVLAERSMFVGLIVPGDVILALG